ncbi:MAG: hypothetical protein ACE5H7_17845 [Acidiferrobacterales bacterium]
MALSKELLDIIRLQKAHVLATQEADQEVVSFNFLTRDGLVAWTRCKLHCLKCQAREAFMLEDLAWDLGSTLEVAEVLETTKPTTPSET